MKSTSSSVKKKGDKKTVTKHFWFVVRENISVAFKTSSLLVWFILFLLALLEIKRYYNIDVIPGYDSSVDDVYGFVRGSISEFFK